MSAIYQRCKLYEQPFIYICDNLKIKDFCSYCLRKPTGGKQLLMCANCKHSRYCDKNCQRLGWAIHKPECKRLRAVFPNLPLTEVMFIARALDRVRFIEEKGDVHNWQKDRPFWDLMSHIDDIREDKEKFSHFEKIHGRMETYMGDKMVEKDVFFEVFGRVSINSHSIHNSAGDEIGMALDLGVSRYDHSCRPNCTLVFDGFRACLRPLLGGFDAGDWRKGRISYTDVGKSRYRRRKTLLSKWYFLCECERCVDPDDDRLTSIKCVNPSCEEPIIIHEESQPLRIHCPKCRSITEPERILEAQDLMKRLPDSFPHAEGGKREEPIIIHEESQPLRIYCPKCRSITEPERILEAQDLMKRLPDSFPHAEGGKREEPIIIHEESQPLRIHCPKCRSITEPERILEAQDLMKRLPDSFPHAEGGKREEPIIIHEESQPLRIHCPKCRSITEPERILEAQDLMKRLPDSFPHAEGGKREEPIIIHEESQPLRIHCPKCRSITEPERILEAQDLMKRLPDSFPHAEGGKREEPIIIHEESQPLRIHCPKCRSITEPERILEAQGLMKRLPDSFPHAEGGKREEPIIIHEESQPLRIHCPKCRSITEPERILEAQDLMKRLPDSFPHAEGGKREEPIIIHEESQPLRIYCPKCRSITEPERILEAQDLMKRLPDSFPHAEGGKREEPIIIHEESQPLRIHCPKCRSITEPERILEAQDLMKRLPDSFPHAEGNEKLLNEMRNFLAEAERVLHPENIYYCRLLTAATHIDPQTNSNPEMHKLVYSNYRRCFPQSDRHTGYQLLHIVRSLLDQNRRDEATPYAYEAMTIFEVVFGLDHPYYLQTLALWTFLENGTKTDEELLNLLNFNYNRPLDIGNLLGKDFDPEKVVREAVEKMSAEEKQRAVDEIGRPREMGEGQEPE